MKAANDRILIEMIKSALQQTKYAMNAEPVDWVRLFQLAQSHSIANILYYTVKDLNTVISDPFRLEWLRSVQIDTVQMLETANILKLLNEEHIRCVPLKGYVLKSLYPSPEMRSMGDIDILIDAGNMAHVTEIMLKAGFTPNSNQGGGNHYIFDKKPFTHVEFHHSLFDMSSPFSKYFNPGWQYVAEANERDCSLNFSKEGFYIFVVGHLINHFTSGGTGIRSIMDVWVYNQHYEQKLDWTFINSEFKRARLLQFAQNIKDLADVWFGTKEPTELLNELGDYIIGSGTYGTSDQAALSEVLKSDDETAIGIRKIKAFSKRVFLPIQEMQYRYAFLKKLPVLLPVGWFLRGIRVLKTRKVILHSWITNVSNVNHESLNEYKQMFQRFGL